MRSFPYRSKVEMDKMVLLLTILILPAGVEISAECYRSCQKDPMQTCDLPGYKCAKTKIYGYMCMPVDAIDECLSNPCKNGGSCTDNLDSYTCTCPDTHLGINCDVVNHCVENPCKNGGTCTNNPDDYTCSCCDGWTGPTCEGNTHDCYNITDKDIESGKSEEEICQSQNKIRVTLSNVPAGCEDCDGCCQYKDCFSGAVQDYSGTWHRTNTGRLCQRWDSQDPQSHLFTTDSYFPMDGSVFDAHNYCRDPDSSGDLWCYTVDATQRWESCGIPACNCQPMDLSRDLPETNSFK